MCEFCNTKFYVQVERYSKPILAPLTEVEELECELINKTGFQYMQIQNNYCPLCRKEARRVNKEEIVQRLKFVADEIDKDIKIFEETHNFEHIYDYNVYSIKEFIDEFINIMNTMKEDKQ